MALASQDIIQLSVGDDEDVSVGFIDRLVGDTITAVAVAEQTTSDLTLSENAANTSSVDIDDNAETVTHTAGQAAQFRVSGGTAANSPYVVRMTLTTATGRTIVWDQKVSFVDE